MKHLVLISTLLLASVGCSGTGAGGGSGFAPTAAVGAPAAVTAPAVVAAHVVHPASAAASANAAMSASAQHTITKAKAERIALQATRGGSVISAQYDYNDGHPYWQVNVAKSNAQFEVTIDANSGKVLQIVRSNDGGDH